MISFMVELRKQKRTGILLVLLLTGILGALYAFLNYKVRGDSLLKLPLAPMDVLLTQLYGMIMVLNLFGIIVVTCMTYHIEFKENAIKKMHILPINTGAIWFNKFIILAGMLFVAILLQNLALLTIGITKLPQGTFHIRKMLVFAGYSYITALPVLSFMLLVTSRVTTIGVSLGIGVVGFISAMTMVGAHSNIRFLHPFLIMLRPAMVMSAEPEDTVILFALVETIAFLVIGIWASKHLHYE